MKFTIEGVFLYSLLARLRSLTAIEHSSFHHDVTCMLDATSRSTWIKRKKKTCCLTCLFKCW